MANREKTKIASKHVDLYMVEERYCRPGCCGMGKVSQSDKEGFLYVATCEERESDSSFEPKMGDLKTAWENSICVGCDHELLPEVETVQ
jgi:hypothetical protein